MWNFSSEFESIELNYNILKFKVKLWREEKYRKQTKYRKEGAFHSQAVSLSLSFDLPLSLVWLPWLDSPLPLVRMHSHYNFCFLLVIFVPWVAKSNQTKPVWFGSILDRARNQRNRTDYHPLSPRLQRLSITIVLGLYQPHATLRCESSFHWFYQTRYHKTKWFGSMK